MPDLHGLAVYAVSCVLLAVVVEAITEVLVASKLFAPVRTIVATAALPVVDGVKRHLIRYMPLAFLNAIFGCGYCMSVWVAAAAAISVRIPLPLETCCFGAFIVNTMVLHRLANFLHIVVMIVYKGRVATHDYKVDVTHSGAVQHQTVEVLVPPVVDGAGSDQPA